MAIRQWLMAGVNKYANLRAENNSRKHSNRSKPQEQQAGSKAKTSHIFSFTQEIASPNIGRKPKLSKMTMTIDTPLAHVSFPRTGKRGVPQQFPRRLYEMLDSETKLVEVDPNHPVVITWSDSGKAFRIHDVAEFAASVLPKYFRTKKFSSFQRNLNLYGFAKVRRGPETDMYAHSSFVRDEPKSLMNLRKITAASRKRLPSDASHSTHTTCTARSVSPSFSGSSHPSSPTHTTALVSPIGSVPPPVPRSFTIPGRCDRGKLDLLALAMEREFAARS